MAGTALNKTDFETLYGTNSGSCVFKDNTSGDIGANDTRSFANDAKESFINKLDEGYKKFTATAAGTNTYTATLNPAISAYSATDVYFILFTNGNTGASTLNLNGLGAKAIVKNGSTAIISGDISAGQVYALAYDGTNLQILGKLSSIGYDVHTATAAGTATYTATLSPAITAYSATEVYWIKFTSANTGASTLNLNSIGGVAIKKNGTAALAAGDIAAGQIYAVAYDGTNFQILGNIFSLSNGLSVTQTTLGNPILTLTTTASNADPQEFKAHNKVNTTDATQTVIQSITTQTGELILISGYVLARRTGGAAGAAGDSAAYRIEAAYSNEAATVTAIGTPSVTVIGESQPAWDVDFNVSGQNVRVRVTGAVNNNISWMLFLDLKDNLGA
jgi:hypothetical protein